VLTVGGQMFRSPALQELFGGEGEDALLEGVERMLGQLDSQAALDNDLLKVPDHIIITDCSLSAAVHYGRLPHVASLQRRAAGVRATFAGPANGLLLSALTPCR
jgi:hypothetical protein